MKKSLHYSKITMAIGVFAMITSLSHAQNVVKPTADSLKNSISVMSDDEDVIDDSKLINIYFDKVTTEKKEAITNLLKKNNPDTQNTNISEKTVIQQKMISEIKTEVKDIKDVKDIQLVEKIEVKEVAKKDENKAIKNNLPTVWVLGTGGTIAGSGESSTTTIGYKAATVGVERLISGIPEVKKIANIEGEQVFQIASENFTDEKLIKLAKRVQELLENPEINGIVITHGTDTIEETAYFLNLVIKSDKPVVIVGSMRPSTAMSADGPINLYNAITLASTKEAKGQGVMVVLNDEINAARDVTKSHTTAMNTFKSPDFGILGYMTGGKAQFYRKVVRKHTLDTEFDIRQINELPKVQIVYGYSGNDRTAVDAYAQNNMVKGIIHAGTGDGSLHEETKKALIDARQKGLQIVRSSRTGTGVVYHNGENNDDETNFISGDSLLPQKARLLLALALLKTKDTKVIQEIFSKY
jgi:L-asparaginase